MSSVPFEETKSKTNRKKNMKKLTPYFFLAPFLFFFVSFMVYPILNSLYLSFTSSQGSMAVSWVGLDNFKAIISDKLFWKSLGNVFIVLLVQVPVMLCLGTILANFLNSKNLKFKLGFRLMVFLPVIIDLVTYSIVFSIIFNEDYGIVNYLLSVININPIAWFTDPFWSKLLIIIAVTWRWTGYNTIIILSGLQSIDDSLYESSDLDGASKTQQLLKITVPMLKPILLFCAVLSTIGTINLYTEPSLLTNGGPNNATNTPVMYIFQYGFESFNYGYASAAAYITTIIVGSLSFLQMRFSKGGKIDA